MTGLATDLPNILRRSQVLGRHEGILLVLTESKPSIVDLLSFTQQ